MQTINSSFQPAVNSAEGRCPVEHSPVSHKKTRLQELGGPAFERDAGGTWHIRNFELTRSILRNNNTCQAGFKAELFAQMPHMIREPILYQDGKVHHEQRRQTARFFAPRTVSLKYRELMERLADRLIARLRSAGRADLSRLAMEMAVGVAAQVVGLTNSRLPGMDARLAAFFKRKIEPLGWRPRALWHYIGNQRSILTFFLLDVQPAIKVRRRQPREDLISHLLAQGYNGMEILTECVTFAAAGMVTTREFISIAAWHLMEQPSLRVRYLTAPEEERYAILHEILRLEPVVGHIYRRATADLLLDHHGQSILIPQGSLIDLHIHMSNTDGDIVGEHALQLCPARKLAGERIPAELMSFGDGAHRCPGSYLAIQETDTLLTRLLALADLSIERKPGMGWNDITAGYELREFIVTLK